MLDYVDASPLLTVDTSEVAGMLQLSKATVISWARTDRIPAYRVGRSWIMLRGELNLWLEATNTQPRDEYQRGADFLAGLPPLLTRGDVARLLHVSEPTVMGLLGSGAIAHLALETTVRIPLSALRSFLADVRNGNSTVSDAAG